jgi:methionyl-tRNA formyltransferase
MRSGIVVACGEGALRLTELQKAGRQAPGGGEFLKGFSFEGLAFE